MNSRKTLIAGLCVVLTAACAARGRYEPLANEGKRGLSVRYIDHVLQLRPEEVDLATAVLTVSEEWSGLVDRRRHIEKVDKMAIEIRERLREKALEPDYRAVAEINKYLFEEMKFKTVAQATDPNDLFLHTVLERKKGYCLSLSVLYLSIAERLGVPLKGVVVPGHFFVRYNDGRVRFNIETTNAGRSAPDEYYRDKYGVPEDVDTLYMTDLNKLQTLGCFFNNLGNTYSDIGDTEASLMAFARAVEVTPTLGEARTNLGNVYLRTGQIADAVSEYMAALQINPKDAKTRNNLGNAYTELGQLGHAVNQYLYALELDGDYVDAYRNLAIAYTRQKKYGQAIVQLQRALLAAPKDAAIYSQIGDVYVRAGDYDKALSQFKLAIRLDGKLAEAYFGMAMCYNRQGLAEEEIEAYRKALMYDPKLGAAWANLGNAYFGQGQYDLAVQHYRRAIQIRGDDASVYYNLGSAHLRQEEFSFAVSAYSSAIAISPEMGDAHYGLAYAYYKLGKYGLARRHAMKAWSLGVDVPQEQIDAIEAALD